MVGYYFLNQSCVKMQKIPSAFLVSLSTESFIICMMMHTKRTCKYNMQSFSKNSTVDRTHLFLVTLSFQAFRNTVCSCMHSSMKYFPALKECVQSNKHRANIFYSRNCDFIMLCITSVKHQCFSVQQGAMNVLKSSRCLLLLTILIFTNLSSALAGKVLVFLWTAAIRST